MPPKPAKDQTKSTPTNKSANEKDTIKGLKKLVDSLEKEKETREKKLKEKDEEIERLKVVSTPAANGTTGEGNIQDQSKEIKRANEKDMIKELQKKVTNLEKEKRTWEQKLKEKDEEIERLKVVKGFCGEGDNVSTTPITNSRDLRSAPAANGTIGEGNILDQIKEIKRLTEENKKLKEELKKPKDKSKTMQQPGVKKEDTSICSQVSLSDIPLEGLIDYSSNQTNNNSRETRSAPAANDTTGEGNIQDQSKEIKRSLFEDETSKTAAQVPVPDSETLMNDLLERNKRLVVENSELKEQIKKSNSLKSAASRDLKDAEAQVKQLKEKNEKLMEEKNKAVKEVDNLKNRALGSKIYGPLDLAEKFSEVYDDEWTDALKDLLEKINNEKAVIQILLHIVMDAYQFCTETFSGSLKEAVSQTFKTMTLTDSQLKVMNDYRMATAEHLVTNLQEVFCRANKFDEGSVTHYQKACIRVCWLMTVQDPPVFMDGKENATGAKFDSDKYKCFTKEGNVVDYIVWPVLYLHKGGPMISKGIAQKK